MRTFLCLPIDASTRRALGSLSEELRQVIAVRASWVPAENFHVTVRFLGEVDPMLTVDLEQICRPVAERIAPFDLSIDRLGVFPSPARPRVLWAGGEPPPEFVALISSVNEALEKLGFPEEGKKPVAHITLTRIKGRADQSIAQAIHSFDDRLGWTLHANRLILMESRLTSRGAVYTPLFTLPFGGNDAV